MRRVGEEGRMPRGIERSGGRRSGDNCTMGYVLHETVFETVDKRIIAK